MAQDKGNVRVKCVTWPQFPKTESRFHLWQRCTPWIQSCTPVEGKLPHLVFIIIRSVSLYSGITRWANSVTGRRATDPYPSEDFPLLSFNLPFRVITLIPKKYSGHVFCSSFLQNIRLVRLLFGFPFKHLSVWLCGQVHMFQTIRSHVL